MKRKLKPSWPIILPISAIRTINYQPEPMLIKKTTKHADRNTGSGLVQAQQSVGVKPIKLNTTPSLK